MRQLTELDNLIHVNRYSGNLLVKKESVADHVWCMNALALEYVPILNDKFHLALSLEKIIYGIALHDIDEAFYCDIPRNFKYHNPKLREVIANTVESILREKLPPEIIEDIHKAEDKNNYIGCIIKIFDLAQAGYKMISEIKLGNEYFKGELYNVDDTLSGMKLFVCDNSELHKSVKPALIWLIEEFQSQLSIYLSR